MQTPQEYFELYQNASQSKAFEQEQAMTQSVLASNLAALERGGSRALIGGAPAAVLQSQRATAAAAERDFQRQQRALAQLAAAQARTAGFNFQAQSSQYARDLMTAQAGYQAGAETMLSGVETAIGAGALALQSGTKRKPSNEDTDQDLNQDLNLRSDQPVDSTPFGYTGPIDERFGLEYNVPDFNYEPMNFDFGQSDFGFQGGFGTGITATFDPYSAFPFSNTPRYRYQGPRAQGGSVTTPGKYTADHSVEYDVKTKSGKTIATLTGDETLVFNPQQRRFLKKIIGKLIKGKTIKPSKADTKQANQTLKAFKK